VSVGNPSCTMPVMIGIATPASATVRRTLTQQM
jgi:hypothetical protein